MTIAERRDALRARFPEWEPTSLGRFLGRCAAEFGDRP
jgi:fatty-acyl-CoA synthase